MMGRRALLMDNGVRMSRAEKFNQLNAARVVRAARNQDLNDELSRLQSEFGIDSGDVAGAIFAGAWETEWPLADIHRRIEMIAFYLDVEQEHARYDDEESAVACGPVAYCLSISTRSVPELLLSAAANRGIKVRRSIASWNFIGSLSEVSALESAAESIDGISVQPISMVCSSSVDGDPVRFVFHAPVDDEMWAEMQPAIATLSITGCRSADGLTFIGDPDELDQFISWFYDGSDLSIQIKPLLT